MSFTLQIISEGSRNKTFSLTAYTLSIAHVKSANTNIHVHAANIMI